MPHEASLNDLLAKSLCQVLPLFLPYLSRESVTVTLGSDVTHHCPAIAMVLYQHFKTFTLTVDPSVPVDMIDIR